GATVQSVCRAWAGATTQHVAQILSECFGASSRDNDLDDVLLERRGYVYSLDDLPASREHFRLRQSLLRRQARYCVVPDLPAIESEDLSLMISRGIIHAHVQQKAVELRFRQWIGALLLDRVLGRHDHEQFREPMGSRAYRDLPFRHGLQDCRLNFGRRPVNFV